MAAPLQPRNWVEFTLEPYPVEDAFSESTIYRWATRPLAGPLFIEGRVSDESSASITRRASSSSGEPHIDSASLVIDDTDGRIRALLADVTTQWFKNREVAYKLLSAAAFAAGLTPRIRFGGRCYDVQPLDGRKVQMEFEDLLAPYMDRLYPQYTIGDAYPFAFEERGPTPVSGLTLSAAIQPQPHAAPTLAATLQSGGQGVSGITRWYAFVTVHAGVRSELSNVVPITFDDTHTSALLEFSGLAVGADTIRMYSGRNPEFTQYDVHDIDASETDFLDEFPGYDLQDPPPTGADPLWGLDFRQQRYYSISNVYSDGSESMCSAPIQVNLYPRNAPLTVRLTKSGTPTPVSGLTVTGYKIRRDSQSYHFEIAPSREWEVTDGDFPFDDPNDDTSAVSACVQDGPRFNVPAELRRQVIPIYYGPFIDTAVDPITGMQRSKGLLPTFHMGFTQLDAGTGTIPEPSAEIAALLGSDVNGWGELLVCLGEMDEPNVYLSDMAEVPSRVRLDENRYGQDVLVPGKNGWPLETNYVMRNGFRVTVIFARGPVLWHHILGLVNITVDGCGWKNSDGVAIDQAGFVYQDFLTQHVLAHDGNGYTSGPPIGLPEYANGRSMFWTSRIQAWQTMTADRLNTAKGYLCSMALTEPTTLREILRTFHVTFDCFSAKNAAGQLYLFSIDDLADPTDGTPVREPIELRSLPAPRIAWEEIENWIDYTVGWDPEQKKVRTTPQPLKNTAAISALKEIRRVTREMRFTADDATALDAVGRRLMRLKQAPRYQALPLSIAGVDREIGDQVLVSHQDGIGPAGVGYDAVPMIALEHLQQGNEVVLSAFELSRILTAASRWAEDAVPDWDSATEEQQALFGFWATDDDTVGAANEPAPEWR